MVSSSGQPPAQWPLQAAALESVSQRWTRRDSMLIAGIWALTALALALLSVAAHFNSTFPGDEGLAVLIQKIQFPPLVRFINVSSDANWPAPAAYAALAIIIALLLARQLSAAIATVAASFGADFANVALNSLVARPRPNNIHIHVLGDLGQHSFPSGHVTHVITFYGFLLYLTFRFAREHPQWIPLLWVVRIVCLYFLVFIGPSRVLEAEHWPSDVLGGYLLASLMLVIAVALYHLLLMGFARLNDWLAMRKPRKA